MKSRTGRQEAFVVRNMEVVETNKNREQNRIVCDYCSDRSITCRAQSEWNDSCAGVSDIQCHDMPLDGGQVLLLLLLLCMSEDANCYRLVVS